MNFLNCYVAFLFFSSLYRIKRLGQSYSQPTTQGQVFAGYTFALLLFLYILVAVLAVVEYFYFQRPIDYWITGLGLSLYVAVIPLRNWAIRVLGEAMSPEIEIRPQQKLVTDGPYRYLRHPLSVLVIIELIGFTLVPNSYYSLLAVFILFIPFVVYRIRLEEKVLRANFGEEYNRYQQQVYAFFPLRRYHG